MSLPLRPVSNAGRILVSLGVVIVLAIVGILSVPPLRAFRRRAAIERHLGAHRVSRGPGVWRGTVHGPPDRTTPMGALVAAWRHSVDTGGKYHVLRCQGGELGDVVLEDAGIARPLDRSLLVHTRWHDGETTNTVPSALTDCTSTGFYREDQLARDAVVTVVGCATSVGLVACGDGVDTIHVGSVDDRTLLRVPFDDDVGARLTAYALTFVAVGLLAFFASRYAIVAKRKPRDDGDTAEIHVRGLS